MTAPLSRALRERIVRAVESGSSIRQAARRFAVSASAAIKLMQPLEPGDVVAMDNLSTHKVAGVQEAIRAVGASVLYLPSDSPDFNPIEQLFAKFKSLLRKAAARTQTALWETFGTLLDDFTPVECQNYIANSGYEFV